MFLQFAYNHTFVNYLPSHFAELIYHLSKREKYIETNFDYIPPVPIPIGKIGNKMSFFQYLPVKETLRRLVSNPSLRKYIVNYVSFSAEPSVS